VAAGRLLNSRSTAIRFPSLRPSIRPSGNMILNGSTSINVILILIFHEILAWNVVVAYLVLLIRYFL
jgi:hypothetical protein